MPARLNGLLVALPLLLSTACAMFGAGSMPERALAPPAAVDDRSFQQILTVYTDTAERRLIAAGQIRNGVLVLALLTPAGMELLRLRHDADGLVVHRERDLPPGMTPRAMLADFQLVHWPAEALRAAWGDRWTLIDRTRQRILSYRSQPQVRVEYDGQRWHDPVELEHRQYGYRLQVKTLSHDRHPQADESTDGQ